MTEMRLLIKNNLFTVACMILFLIGLLGYLEFRKLLDNAKRLPDTVIKCESVNYESLSFLATYIIPLVCFSLNSIREEIVLFILITITGYIFAKTNLYYTNPTLLLIGFNVYKVSMEYGFLEGIIIVRGNIQEGDSVKYFHLSDNVYFGRLVHAKK